MHDVVVDDSALGISFLEETSVHIRSSINATSLYSVLSDAFSALGFQHYNLSCNKPDTRSLQGEPTLSSVPANFTSDYQHGQFYTTDPNMLKASRQQTPFFWHSAELEHVPEQEAFRELLSSHNICSGLIIPLTVAPGDLSGLILCAERHITPSLLILKCASIIANAAMVKAQSLGLCDTRSIDEHKMMNELSPIQLKILDWAAAGKSNTDIATILAITPRGVTYHMSSIIRKLGVASRAQAIALSARLGRSA